MIIGKIMQNLSERRDGERLKEKILQTFDSEMSLTELLGKLCQISKGALLKMDNKRQPELHTTKVFMARDEREDRQKSEYNNSYKKNKESVHKPRYEDRKREEMRSTNVSRKKTDEARTEQTPRKNRGILRGVTEQELKENHVCFSCEVIGHSSRACRWGLPYCQVCQAYHKRGSQPRCRDAPPWKPSSGENQMFLPYNSQVDMDRGVKAQKPERFTTDRRGPRTFTRKKEGYKPSGEKTVSYTH